MMLEDYKEIVRHKLGNANDCAEVEQIVDCSIERIPEKNLFRYLVIIYLHILQNELQKPSGQRSDSSGKCNIRHALNYLREMNYNRCKVV